MNRFPPLLTLLAFVILEFGLSPARSQDRYEPATLFLTWFEDPTTTMVIQWLEPALSPPPADDADIPDLPLVEDLKVDGDDSEWRDNALDVKFLAGRGGAVPPADDFAASFHIAWTYNGLVLSVKVTDDHLLLSPKPDEVEDGVVISVCNPKDPSTEYTVAVGPDTAAGGARYKLTAGTARELKVDASLTQSETGYSGEIFLPWENLRVLSTVGGRVNLQVSFVDFDPGESEPRRLVWHSEEIGDHHALQFVLAQSGPAVMRFAVRDLPDPERVRIAVIGPPEAAGEIILARAGRRRLGSGRMERQGNKSSAVLEITSPPSGRSWSSISITSDGDRVGWHLFDAFLWREAKEAIPIYCRVADEDITVGAGIHRFGDSPILVRRAVLTGLEPGTSYLFRIGDSRTRHRFQTAPATLTKPLVFAEGGGVGTGPTVAELHARVASWNPLFVLLGGDIAGGSAEGWVDFLDLWNSNMVTADGSHIPLLACIGDEEVSGGHNQPPEKAPYFRALFGGLYPNHHYNTLDFGKYLSLVLLDSGHTAPMDGAQTDWLANALEARARRPHVFAAYHLPAYPTVQKFYTDNSAAIRKHWCPLFEQFGISAAFEHHDGTYKRTIPMKAERGARDGITYFGDGCWARAPGDMISSSKLYFLKKGSATSNAIRVTLDGDTESFHVINGAGETIDTYEVAPKP